MIFLKSFGIIYIEKRIKEEKENQSMLNYNGMGNLLIGAAGLITATALFILHEKEIAWLNLGLGIVNIICWLH